MIEKYFGKQRIPAKFVAIPAFLALCVLAMSVTSAPVLEYDLTLAARFGTFLLSILIQAFPFLLAGTLLSSIIGEFVPRGAIERLLGKSPVIAVPASILCAFLFPVCDCASVPVAARLAERKVPPSAVVTFMLSSPIINPVVVLSTIYAFPENRSFVWARVIIGVTVPVIAGLVIQRLFSRSSTGITVSGDHHTYEHDGHSCSCGHCDDHHEHDAHEQEDDSLVKRIMRTLAHTGEEFVGVMPYIIAGAAVSAVLQTVIPKNALASFGTGAGLAAQTLVMMAAAFLLSVCSTSDAFIARGFLFTFAPAPVLAFMAAGPMIDLKNVLMMTPYFRKRFIIALICLIFILISASAAVFSLIVQGGIR